MRRTIFAMILAASLPAASVAQEAPLSDVSVGGFIDALIPKPQMTLRGGLNTRGVSATPKIDIAAEFEYDSAVLSEEARGLLANLALAIQSEDLAGYHFWLRGHTDSVGTEEYNEGLSLARAESVREFLVQEYRISANRLVTRGYGESRLLYEDLPEDARNRRVEIMTLQ